MNLDLHKLANEGGFGKAQEALKQAGCWDPCAAADGEAVDFLVSLSAAMPVTATVRVKARSEEEAEELAIEIAEKPQFSGWQFNHDAEDFDIIDVEPAS